MMGRGMLDEQTGFLCNVLVVSLQEGSAYHASNGMSALGGGDPSGKQMNPLATAVDEV